MTLPDGALLLTPLLQLVGMPDPLFGRLGRYYMYAALVAWGSAVLHRHRHVIAGVGAPAPAVGLFAAAPPPCSTV